MEMAKLTSKGQITIPVDVRRKLDLRVGSRIIFIEQNNGFFVVNESNVNANAIKRDWSKEYKAAILRFGETADPTFIEQPELPWSDRGEMFD